MTSHTLYLRNKNTGEIHRLFMRPEGKYSKEECNTDDIDDAEEVAEDVYLKAGDDQCSHCREEPDAT